MGWDGSVSHKISRSLNAAFGRLKDTGQNWAAGGHFVRNY